MSDFDPFTDSSDTPAAVSKSVALPSLGNEVTGDDLFEAPAAASSTAFSAPVVAASSSSSSSSSFSSFAASTTAAPAFDAPNDDALV